MIILVIDRVTVRRNADVWLAPHRHHRTMPGPRRRPAGASRAGAGSGALCPVRRDSAAAVQPAPTRPAAGPTQARGRAAGRLARLPPQLREFAAVTPTRSPLPAGC